ncbi:hypothetical protein BDU57DRAFT_364423 [Ampelomyces quisqualis]|uniref:Uncharacterized protein n=1 Tax=Ampelomyces quisqualis TaxID=50730 RepID=A0A6A5QC72_AMPQU|nr:hypothetical protein BDU57DRAFT_364423 [Ampelomyces quisqualis]
MCYYRFYIFLGCGHTTTSSTPIRHCANATKSATTATHKDSSQITSPAEIAITTNGFALDLDAGSRLEGKGNSSPEAQQDQSAFKPAEDAVTRVKPNSKALDLDACGKGRIHPLHTVKVACLCASCAIERDERLQSLDLDSIEFRIEPKRRQPKHTERYQALLLDRGSGERQRNLKVDSGVWTVGARWMKDWKGQG